MNDSLNITNLLLIYQKDGEFMTDVDENIETFVRVVSIAWKAFGIVTMIVNLIIFLATLKINRSQRIYHLIQVNCVLKLLQGVIYTFVNNIACVYCKSNFYGTFVWLFLTSYLSNKISDLLLIISGLFEILITLDRLSILKQNWVGKFFKRQDIKCIIPFAILFASCLMAPDFLYSNIVQIDDDLYYRNMNSLSNSFFYDNIYMPIRITITLALLITYIISVILLLKNYNEFLKKKKRLKKLNIKQALNKKIKVNKNERDLIKLVIFESSFNITAAIAAVAGQVINKFEFKIKYENPTNYYMGYLVIMNNTCIVIGLFALSVADIAIFVYNSNLRQLFQMKQPDQRTRKH